eukprot:3090234-Prymnesium_polylepis.1
MAEMFIEPNADPTRHRSNATGPAGVCVCVRCAAFSGASEKKIGGAATPPSLSVGDALRGSSPPGPARTPH